MRPEDWTQKGHFHDPTNDGGDLDILSSSAMIEVIAKGLKIRERKRLWKVYGRRAWRKLKGIASIKFSDGTRAVAELHWYEAHGIGKKEFKVKRLIEEEE